MVGIALRISAVLLAVVLAAGLVSCIAILVLNALAIIGMLSAKILVMLGIW
ncbi:hypothetical protein [Rhodovulum sp. BSW8]|uniref:hypothetical protein n=1 Tax=Rhodovulum sp. BSW8 TaxID=2259645 RepID=UPI001401C7FE|nr:hypothetical protein [Rhodovulum sp. BSW8]